MPNFEPRTPTASPACVSGVTSGLRRRRTSSGRVPRWPSRARVAIAPSARASSSDSIDSQRSGSPSRAARTAAARSRSVLPIPSSVTASLGRPARRATAHSPRETTFAPTPLRVTSPTIAGTSFALSENWRSHGSGNASARRAAAASSVAVSVTWMGVPNRRAASRSAGARSATRAASGASSTAFGAVVTLAEEEAGAERVVRVQDELVATGDRCAALDLRDDGRPPGDVAGEADDRAPELCVDDAHVAEDLALPKPALVGEAREACRGPAAARRAVHLAVGKDRHVPLDERAVRVGRLVLPEHDPVDAREIGLIGVDDRDGPFERRPELALERDQRRQAGAGDLEAERADVQ